MKQPYVFATDIGSSNVKVMVGQATTDGGLSIKGMGTAPTLGFAKGVVHDAPALADAVRQALDCACEAAATAAGPIYLGISTAAEGIVHIRGSIALTSQQGITQEEISRVCRAAVLLNIPEDVHLLHAFPTRYWCDGKLLETPLGEVASQLEAELCAVTIHKQVLSDLADAFYQRGIELSQITANIVNGTSHLAGNHPCLVMDIGAGISGISYYYDGLKTAAILPIGGEYITQDIAQTLGVSVFHAEEIKRYYAKLNRNLYQQGVILDCNDYGTTDKHVAYDFLYKIVESRIEELVDLLREGVLPTYSAAAQEIILTGGCVYLPSMVQRISEVFQLPVRIATMQGVLREYDFPTNTAAYGLLQYGINQTSRVAPPTAMSSLWKRIKSYF